MWFGSFASNIGTWMQNVVLPAYVYHRTGSASVVSFFVFAQLGPLLLLSVPAGVFADRLDRRKWLIATQCIQLICSAGLAPLAAANSALWMLFLMQLGVGIGNALNAPAWSAVLPTLVPREDLPGAIALNSTVINGSRVVGPMIVAVLATWGVTTAQFFLINSVTYLFVVASLLIIHIPKHRLYKGDPGWRQFTTGFRIVKSRPVLSRLLLSLCSFSLLSLPFVGLFPAVARINFGIDASGSTYKWLYATWGLGACIGGLAIGTVFVGSDKRRMIQVGFGCFAVALLGFAISSSPTPAFITGFLLGFAYFFTTTSMNTILQSRLENEVRGRVMALWFVAFGGTIPIGNMIFGPIIDRYGARWMLLIGAAWAMVLARWCDIAKIDGRFNADQHTPDN